MAKRNLNIQLDLLIYKKIIITLDGANAECEADEKQTTQYTLFTFLPTVIFLLIAEYLSEIIW